MGKNDIRTMTSSYDGLIGCGLCVCVVLVPRSHSEKLAAMHFSSISFIEEVGLRRPLKTVLSCDLSECCSTFYDVQKQIQPSG